MKGDTAGITIEHGSGGKIVLDVIVTTENGAIFVVRIQEHG